MVIHLIHHEKFTKPYVDFINDKFNPHDHLFLITSDQKQNGIFKSYKNVVFIKNSFALFKKHIPYFKSANKIIVHGLFSEYLILSLYLNSKYLERCYWVIWGGDLYNVYYNRNKTIKTLLLYQLRKRVIVKIKHLISFVEGDFNLVEKIFNPHAHHHYSFTYTSNVFTITKPPLTQKHYNKSDKYVVVQVGNSGSQTNNHLEVFHKLKKYNNIKVYVPLSYGDSGYIKKVIDVGQTIFGNRFIPLTTYLPYEEYLEYLDQIDVAIFNHDRQEGFGNIIQLLGRGKKVSIRKDISTFSELKKHKILIFDSSENNYDSLINSNFEDIVDTKLVKEIFSHKALINQWEKIFNN